MTPPWLVGLGISIGPGRGGSKWRRQKTTTKSKQTKKQIKTHRVRKKKKAVLLSKTEDDLSPTEPWARSQGERSDGPFQAT